MASLKVPAAVIISFFLCVVLCADDCGGETGRSSQINCHTIRGERDFYGVVEYFPEKKEATFSITNVSDKTFFFKRLRCYGVDADGIRYPFRIESMDVNNYQVSDFKCYPGEVLHVKCRAPRYFDFSGKSGGFALELVNGRKISFGRTTIRQRAVRMITDNHYLAQKFKRFR